MLTAYIKSHRASNTGLHHCGGGDLSHQASSDSTLYTNLTSLVSTTSEFPVSAIPLQRACLRDYVCCSRSPLMTRPYSSCPYAFSPPWCVHIDGQRWTNCFRRSRQTPMMDSSRIRKRRSNLANSREWLGHPPRKQGATSKSYAVRTRTLQHVPVGGG